MLAHGTCHDNRTWLPLFSICYFHHEKDSDASRLKSQAYLAVLPHRMLFSSPIHATKNTMNPTATKSTRTVCHHRCILPSNTTVAFSSHSTGTTTQRSANPTLMALGFSPSIRHQDKVSMGRLWIYRSIQSCPRSISSFLMMAPLVRYRPPTCPPSSPRMPRSSDSTHLLPPFLQPSCKITYDHEGQLHKGFLGQSQDGVFRFSFKSHINKKSED